MSQLLLLLLHMLLLQLLRHHRLACWAQHTSRASSTVHKNIKIIGSKLGWLLRLRQELMAHSLLLLLLVHTKVLLCQHL